MSGPYVVFRNPGEIHPVSIRTFGISAKDTANPIGYFGTGLKYALAIFMRTHHEVVLFAGTDRYDFNHRYEEVRGKDFRVVTMNNEDLPFTTELGKNWEPWQAFRELYCNALDEGGWVELFNTMPKPAADETLVVLSGPLAVSLYEMRNQIVLDLSRELIVNESSRIEIFDSPSEYLYYRGVRVHKLNRPALFTYNFLEETELTEDRTLKHSGVPMSRIGLHVSSITKRHILRRILNARECFEEQLSFDWLDWNEEFVGDDFLAVLEEAFNLNVETTNKSAMKYWRKRADKDALKNYAPVDLTKKEAGQIERCRTIMSKVFPDFDYEVLVVKTLGTTTMGLADADRRLIVISRDCFRHGTKYLFATMIEEYAHLKTGYGDHTRELQTWLFDCIASMVEEHIIEEAL